MDKPTTKAELISGIKEARKSLEQALKGFSDTDMMKSPAPGEWSIQDIMAHVAAWETKFIGWYEDASRGINPEIPDWSQPGIVDEINLEIYKQNHDRWLKEVRREFKESHKRILKVIKHIPEEDIFVAGRLEWFGKPALLDYILGNTAGHYLDHIPMIEELRRKVVKG